MKEKNNNFTNKKKLPFNVFSKKGLASLAMAGVLMVSPLMFAGCSDGKDGTNGLDGKNGSQWYYSTVDVVDGALAGDVDFTAVEGDFYIDTDGYALYQLKNNRWTIVMENYGRPGTNGQDGTSVYVGYDGYIWQGTEKTNFKTNDITVDEYCVANTLGLVNHDKYFESYSIDTSTTQVALMDNYFETIGKTGLSGVTITNLSLNASKAGQVTIGTAKISDVLSNRVTGTEIALKNKITKTLVSGVNKFDDLLINIGDDETLVLGDAGSDTACLVAYQGINVDDEQGTFATITKGQTQDSANMYATTDEVKDKIVLNVGMISYTNSYQSIWNDANLGSQSVSEMTDVKKEYCPFGYACDYSGRTITKIKVPVKGLTDYTQDQILTIFVYKGVSNGATWVKKTTYTLTIPENTFSDTTVNQWVEFTTVNNDDPMNIVLGEDEGIGFGNKDNDSITWGFSSQYENEKLKLADMNSGTVEYSTSRLMFDLFETVQTPSETTFEKHLETLTTEEKQQTAVEQTIFNEFKSAMTGKNVSILGDSISTFVGYSNNSTDTNSTIRNNYVSYGENKDIPTLSSVDETWWMQVINQLEMQLCVNNSSGGSKVLGNGTNNIQSAYIDRCKQLHDDTTDNNDGGTIINPDYIMVYLGVNDASGNVDTGSFDSINWETLITSNNDGTYTYGTPSNFAEAYAVMIHKMTIKYPNAKIFVFNLGKDFSGNGKLDSYNNTIAKVAEKYGCYLADMTASKMSGTGYANYTSDGVHPTAIGMDVMTEVMIDAMYKAYLQSKNN